MNLDHETNQHNTIVALQVCSNVAQEEKNQALLTLNLSCHSMLPPATSQPLHVANFWPFIDLLSQWLVVESPRPESCCISSSTAKHAQVPPPLHQLGWWSWQSNSILLMNSFHIRVDWISSLRLYNQNHHDVGDNLCILYQMLPIQLVSFDQSCSLISSYQREKIDGTALLLLLDTVSEMNLCASNGRSSNIWETFLLISAFFSSPISHL